MDTKVWAQKYDSIRSNPPAEGAILRAFGDAKVRLNIDLTDGNQPFIYARAYVPSIVGQDLDGWYLQHVETEKNVGWKCVLMPKAREEVIQRFGLSQEVVGVAALRVVRNSRSGKALLVEIAEF